MDDCPRCSTPLETISLNGDTAIYCESCGYADTPVEHDREAIDLESWQEAIQRFQQKHG